MDDSSTSTSSTMIRRQTIQWPGGPAIKQFFSLPFSIIRYIAMNPSNPRVYKKLIETCKFFFERNPILVADTVNEYLICSEHDCHGSGEEGCCVEIDITKITSKIWITRELDLDETNIPNFTALLRPKIYQSDVFWLSIGERIVDFDDFKFLCSSARIIGLEKTQIVYSNGDPVMLENIIKSIPSVDVLDYTLPNITSMISDSTCKNMSKLKNLGKIGEFILYNVPQDFRFDDFYAFFKNQTNLPYRSRFYFADDLSDEYKNQLDQIIDYIIETPELNVYITYRGQVFDKLHLMHKRSFKYW